MGGLSHPYRMNLRLLASCMLALMINPLAARSEEPAAPAPTTGDTLVAEINSLKSKLGEARKTAMLDPGVLALKTAMDNAQKDHKDVMKEVMTRLDPEGKIVALEQKRNKSSREEKKALEAELKALMGPVKTDPAFKASEDALKLKKDQFNALLNATMLKAEPATAQWEARLKELEKQARSLTSLP